MSPITSREFPVGLPSPQLRLWRLELRSNISAKRIHTSSHTDQPDRHDAWLARQEVPDARWCVVDGDTCEAEDGRGARLTASQRAQCGHSTPPVRPIHTLRGAHEISDEMRNGCDD